MRIAPKRLATGLIERRRQYILAGAGIYMTGFLIGGGLGVTIGPVTESAVPLDVAGEASSHADIFILDILAPNLLNVVLMVSGAILLGTISIAIGLKNGFAHGVIVGTSLAATGDAGMVALLFLPHAVFELPGIWVAIAAGTTIPGGFFGYLRKQRTEPVSTADLRDTLVLALLSVACILVGGVVEYGLTLSVIPWVT